MSRAEKPDPTEGLERYVPVPPTGNGHKVRPDEQTKRNLGLAFASAMSLMAFLALQVWNLNGSMRTVEANDRAREKSIEAVWSEIKELRSELRQGLEGVRQEIRESKGK